MKDKREQLLNTGFFKLFLSLSIPSILIGLIAGLYNLVDAIIVGQFIGPEAVGAVSLSYALTLPNWAITFCLGIGSATVISRAIGSRDKGTVEKIPGNLIILGGSFSVLYFLLIQALTSPLLRMIGGSGMILDMGIDYLKMISFGFPLATLGLGFNLVIRGEGRMRDMMIIAGISNLTNIILDYILIEPAGMGVEGAALATVISQGASLLMIISYILLGRTEMKLDPGKIRISRDLLPTIFKTGSSPMMVMILMAIQQMIMFRMLSDRGGEEQIILLSATFKLFTFLPIFTKGVSEGMQPLVGTAFGAGDISRARGAYKTFTIYGSILVAFIYIPMMLFPRGILSFFITDPSILEDHTYFRLFFSSLIFQVAIFNSLYYFLSIGKGREGGMIVMVRQLFLFIPLILILPGIFGVLGIWIVIPLCDCGALVLGWLLIRREFRKKEAGSMNREKIAGIDPKGGAIDG